MNKKTSTLVLLFLAGLVFCSPTKVKATELNIPSSFQIEGLSFDPPFSLLHPINSSLNIPSNVQFGTFSPILVDKPVETPVPEVILPTLSHPTAFPAPVELNSEASNQNTLVTMVVPVVEPSLLIASPSPSVKPSLAPSVNVVPSALIPEASSSPIPTPSASSSPSPSASPSSSPLATPISSPASIKKNLTSNGLDAQKLFDMVNNHRTAMNLPAFEKDDRACSLAESRAPEVGEEIENGHMHSGLRARNLSYWNGENIISMRTEEGAFNWWIHDYIHKVQIEGDYKYSCMACSGNSCVEEFTNFVEKK